MSSSATVWVPILVAIVTGLVTVIAVFLTGRANLKLEQQKFHADSDLEKQKFEIDSKLEKQKFESSLILQAIATGEQEAAKRNLTFLVSAGFLRDPDGKIRNLPLPDTPVLPSPGAARAPVFRWKERSGADPDAYLVKDEPVRTTVEELAAKPRPADSENPTGVRTLQDGRAEGVERTIYELEAAILASRRERQTGAFTLKLQGETGQTMPAECVDPELVDQESRWATQIAEVYNEVAEVLKPGPTWAGESRRARLTGIGFFNRLHGKTGEAPNGVQLTPVIRIEWLS
jgi:hypothetical protein